MEKTSPYPICTERTDYYAELEQEQRYTIEIEGARLSFIEGMNGITPIPYDKTLPYNNNPSKVLQELIESYRIDAAKINGNYPQGIENIPDLKFNNLNLTQLPPQLLMKCTSAKSLDISDNRIFFLPIHLKNLPLETLDISRNEDLQSHLTDFEWLLEMPTLKKIIADDMGFDFIPRGWENILFSNQVSTGYDWMNCPTQCPFEEDYLS